MSVSIQHHSEGTFTVTFNNTDHILTTVTDYAAEVEAWINTILHIHHTRLSTLLVGFDVEWRPSRTSTQNPVAVLQLCVGRRCLVFHIINADHVPQALADFMNDPRFTFLGVGIGGDVERVVEDYELSVSNQVDLRYLAADKMGRNDLRRTGLAGLAREVMGVHVDKPRSVTMSRWDASFLTLDQVSYACVDAFLSFEIGRRLMAGEF